MENLSTKIFTALMKDTIGQYTVPQYPAPETPDASKLQARRYTENFQNQVGYSSIGSTPTKREDPKVAGTLHEYTDGQRSGGFPKNQEQPSSSSLDCENPISTQQVQWQYSNLTQPGRHKGIPAQTANQVGLGIGKESLYHWINHKDTNASFNMMNQEALMHKMGEEMKRVKNEQSMQRLKAMIKEEDFVAKFGVQLINWADLTAEHVFEHVPSCYDLHTETFSNMLMAFKCTLMEKHRKYLFSKVEPGLVHPGFKRPKLDEDFMDMFLNKYDSEAKIKFLQGINPLNNYMENIQHMILMATTPLFQACNDYELNPVTAASSSTELLAALKRTVLLCRRSLVLYGQTFAFISSMRQEKILDALDLQGKTPPPPSHYPNLDDEFLFGKDYLQELRINELRHWKKKENFPTLKKPDPPAAQEELKTLPQFSLIDLPTYVDAKTEVAIARLARMVIEMGPEMDVSNMQRLASNPDYWFIHAKETAAYKLYQMKVEEFRKIYGLSSDSSKLKAPMAPFPQYVQSKVPKAPNPIQGKPTPVVIPQSYCFTPPLPPGPRSKSKILKATTTLSQKGPQHEHPTITAQKLHQEEHPTIPSMKHQELCTISNEMLHNEHSTAVDARTKETADKLAHFVFQIGPHLESVNKAKLASHQEFGFLNDAECPAYQFYEMKLAEYRRSKQLQPVNANSFPRLLSELLHNIRSSTNPVGAPLPPSPDPQSPTDHGAETQDAQDRSTELSEQHDFEKENSRSPDYVPLDHGAEPEDSLHRSTEQHDLEEENSRSPDYVPLDHGAEPQDLLHRTTELSEQCDLDEENVPLETTSLVSHMSENPPQNLKAPEAASPKHDADRQNAETEDQPLVSESCDSDAEQSDTEQSEDFLTTDGDHFPSQCTNTESNAPASGLSSTGLKHPDLLENKPEISEVPLTKTHCVARNFDSVDSCAKQDSHRPLDRLLLNDDHKAPEVCSTEHGRPNYKNPFPPNFNPPVVGGRKCQVSGIPASLSPNVDLMDPVLEAPKPPRPTCTDFTQDCTPQVSDPQETELLKFYEVIQETEREAEERKRLHATTQAASSVPAHSPSLKRDRPETEVNESFASGNEKSDGQPALTKKLKKEMIVAFHGRPGLGYTEAQIKKPLKTVPRPAEQRIGVSNQKRQEDTLVAFRQKMMKLFKGGLPK